MCQSEASLELKSAALWDENIYCDNRSESGTSRAGCSAVHCENLEAAIPFQTRELILMTLTWTSECPKTKLQILVRARIWQNLKLSVSSMLPIPTHQMSRKKPSMSGSLFFQIGLRYSSRHLRLLHLRLANHCAKTKEDS